MILTKLDILLWVAGFIAHLALLVVLLLRRRARAFPVFAALVFLNVSRTLVLFLISREGTRAMYFYAYWSLALVDVALQLGVLYELASRAFRPLGEWASDIRARLAAWMGCSIAVAFLLTWIPEPPSRLWVQVVFLKGSFFSAALMSQLFVGMIVLSSVSGLSWSSYAAKIAKGLAFYSVVTLIFETANTSFGLSGNHPLYDALSRVRMALYLGCVVYWACSLWRHAAPTQKMPDRMRQEVSAISQAVESQLSRLRAEGRS